MQATSTNDQTAIADDDGQPPLRLADLRSFALRRGEQFLGHFHD
jgi:hypothetical protein